MYAKRNVTRVVSTPPATSGNGNGHHSEFGAQSPSVVVDQPRNRPDIRYPTRFITVANDKRSSISRESPKVDRGAEFQIQRLKTLNAELQAKLQMKNAEANQLRLDISRLKTDHERALRQAAVQQRTNTEQMVRTLKHAEDIIRYASLRWFRSCLEDFT